MEYSFVFLYDFLECDEFDIDLPVSEKWIDCVRVFRFYFILPGCDVMIRVKFNIYCINFY